MSEYEEKITKMWICTPETGDWFSKCEIENNWKMADVIRCVKCSSESKKIEIILE
jgi:hypothetical protein